MRNYRAGLIASLLYNTNKKKTAQAMEPLDWFGGKERRDQSPEEALSAMKAWAVLVSKDK